MKQNTDKIRIHTQNIVFDGRDYITAIPFLTNFVDICDNIGISEEEGYTG